MLANSKKKGCIHNLSIVALKYRDTTGILKLIMVLRMINFIPKVMKDWKMVARIAGMDAISNKESVTGVERTVGAVDKIGLEMGVMVQLGESGVINVLLISNY